jgi:hypothetical protein
MIPTKGFGILSLEFEFIGEEMCRDDHSIFDLTTGHELTAQKIQLRLHLLIIPLRIVTLNPSSSGVEERIHGILRHTLQVGLVDQLVIGSTGAYARRVVMSRPRDTVEDKV